MKNKNKFLRYLFSPKNQTKQWKIIWARQELTLLLRILIDNGKLLSTPNFIRVNKFIFKKIIKIKNVFLVNGK